MTTRLVLICGLGAMLLPTVLAQLFSSSDDDAARSRAWTEATFALRESQEQGIPEFLTWGQPADIYPCSPIARPRARSIDFSESLFFNQIAAEHMCSSLALPSPDERSKTDGKTRPFETGSVLAAAFWYPLSRPKLPDRGTSLGVRVRKVTQTGDGVATRQIRIVIPENIRRGLSDCPPGELEGTPPGSDSDNVSIEKFYWVRLKPGQTYQNAACGDFAVLLGFHLVYKIESKGWLWTTFWWDDSQSSPFGLAPVEFTRAGKLSQTWSNYSMDAAYGDPEKVIYNPWRDSEVANRNCAACHEKLAAYGGPPHPTLSFDMVITSRVHF